MNPGHMTSIYSFIHCLDITPTRWFFLCHSFISISSPTLSTYVHIFISLSSGFLFIFLYLSSSYHSFFVPSFSSLYSLLPFLVSQVDFSLRKYNYFHLRRAKDTSNTMKKYTNKNQAEYTDAAFWRFLLRETLYNFILSQILDKIAL